MNYDDQLDKDLEAIFNESTVDDAIDKRQLHERLCIYIVQRDHKIKAATIAQRNSGIHLAIPTHRSNEFTDSTVPRVSL